MNARHDSSRFYKATGLCMNSMTLENSISSDEMAKKISDAEGNYFLRGPELSRSDFDEIESLPQFDIQYDVDTVLEKIESLRKIDKF